MVKMFMTVLEIASFALPLILGLIFVVKSSSSYSESYEHSMFRGMGLSKKQHLLLYKGLGVLLILIGCFIVFKNYIYEGESEFQQSKDFFDEINSNKFDISTAFLLSTLIAIPARMGSSRFPGKPLAVLDGKTVIQRVYESCKKCQKAQDVVVLTDSPEIIEHVKSFGAKAIMTSPQCQSGTERIIEALEQLNADFIVNVQGDEPFISPELIDSIIDAHNNSKLDLVTAVSEITDAETLKNPNVVKALRNNNGEAIYFSRSPLPYVRSTSDCSKWLEVSSYYKHIGIYGYTAKVLMQYDSLPVSVMEKCEMLEQLRFISAGYKFDVVQTKYESIGIDTPEDLEKASEFLKNS